MRAEYAARLDELEQLRERVVGRIEAIDPSLWNASPSGGGWSIAQALEHVVNAESGTLSYMKKKINDGVALPRAGWKNGLRSRLLTVALRTPMKFRAPEGVSRVSDHAPVEDLLSRWDETRTGLHAFVEEFPNELRDRCVFRHPVCGRINLAQTLSFLIEHLRHHEKQFQRIRKALDENGG